MTSAEFYSKLEELTEVSPGSIKGSDLLEELAGWDSLAVLTFVAMADEVFGVSISAKQLEKSRTVADLAKLFPGQISAD